MKLVHSDALPADSVPCVEFPVARPLPNWPGMDHQRLIANYLLDDLRRKTEADVVYWHITPHPSNPDLRLIRIWATPDESGVRARAELADAVRAAFPNLWKKEA